MKNETQIKAAIEWCRSQEQFKQPKATKFENAALALIQTELEAKVSALLWVLENSP